MFKDGKQPNIASNSKQESVTVPPKSVKVEKDDKEDMRKKYEDMSKKFERMENVLLMEAKEVKGIKDRINEIDNVIAKN